MRRPILEKFREEHGDKRFALMHAKAIADIIDKKTAHAQRNFRKAVRGLVKYAIKQGLIEIDPFATVTLAKPKQKGEFRGIIPWTMEECEQFEAFYSLGTKERLAYELLLQAGQSLCDVIRMGRQHIRNGMLTMRRQKTNVPFHAPVTEQLRGCDQNRAKQSSDLSGHTRGRAIYTGQFRQVVPQNLRQGWTATQGRRDWQAALHFAWPAESRSLALGLLGEAPQS